MCVAAEIHLRTEVVWADAESALRVRAANFLVRLGPLAADLTSGELDLAASAQST